VLVSDGFGGTKAALPVADGAPFAIGTPVTVPYSLRYATLAGLLGGGLVWLGPPGIDLAAHLYQHALFDERGFTFWNNFWYAGRYSYVNYSLLYYPLAALVGLKVLATASVAVGASAFGLTVERFWGGCARWAAWAFAVALAASLILAAFPYTLGLACALVALAALQAHRFTLFGLLVLATFAASPLAFLILAVVLAAAYARSRRFLARAGLPVLATGAFGLLLWRLFPGAGRFPFAFSEFAAALVFCLAGLAFTWRVERARLLFALFAIYGATCLVCYLIPSDIGANIVRLRYVAIPVTALTLALRRWRPLLPAIVAFALAASWNTTPLISGFARGASDPSANPSYWAPAIHFLHRRLAPSFRVEAVDTTGHWEAVYLPDAGIPIVRGWFRQDDFPRNQLLYERRLGRAAYQRWLQEMGARYVVLTSAPPDYSSASEAQLLRSGRSGLKVVLRTAEITIFAVPSPVPILTGPAHPRVVALHASSVVLDLHRPGTYKLALTYTPYWSAPATCVTETSDGMVKLTTRHAGLVRLRFDLTFSGALAAFAGATTSCSAPARAAAVPAA
jgi:hypothetical protein